jgi:hypothetical protein
MATRFRVRTLGYKADASPAKAGVSANLLPILSLQQVRGVNRSAYGKYLTRIPTVEVNAREVLIRTTIASLAP